MKKNLIIGLLLLVQYFSFCQKESALDIIQKAIGNPPESAKPWVFWYWVNGCVSKQGVTADLEAMKRVGLGGAYLMFIKDTTAKIDFQPQIRQLSPEWYAMVSHAMKEAKRLNLKIGLHFSDGFALAGGPWIEPEQSMQKLVLTKTIFDKNNNIIAQPETNEGFYKDIKTYAYRLNYKPSQASLIAVTDNKGVNLFHLTLKDSSKTYRSDTTCFIDFKYDRDFTLRNIHIKKQNNAYQAQRFIIQTSDDGVNYSAIDTLVPPKHGWQDNGFGYTHAVKNTISKYFRLLWKKDGSEPGSEELDAAKWKPVLRVQGIYLSEEPTINNYEAKNGSVWRKANYASSDELPTANIVKANEIIDVTKFMAGNILNWQPKDNANYMVVRIGHTSTGQKNETAGGGKGLECDKLNAAAVTHQYNLWFKNIFVKTNAKDVVNTLHIDSWECGSQNWTADFAAQFKRINKYDLDKYLLAAAGVPVSSITLSEKALSDMRNTIAMLMQERFFGTINALAKKDKLNISAESTAPTFVSDGLAHYKHVDIPMGEFWLNSPTHDKPTDMVDAINAAHIYGKNIVGAEAFTTLRMDWSEHPGNLKQLGDWAFAQGINKLAIHVMVHNPWMDKKPGMTLDGIGLYYQRDQPWFEQSKAWIDYLTRTSALLQLGKPVADFAVYIGDDKPVRSLLPHQLMNDFPTLFSKDVVEKEKQRLANVNQPLATIPDGVTHTANTLKAPLMLNAIGNYKYDCINTEMLQQLKVVNGKLVLPSGITYNGLLLPKSYLHKANSEQIIILDKLEKVGASIIEENIQTKKMQSPSVTIDNNKIAFVKRQIPNGELFYFSNQDTIDIETKVKILSTYQSITQYDFITNRKYVVSRNKNNQFDVSLNINANEAILLIATNNTDEEMFYILPPPVFDTVAISNWSIKFSDIKDEQDYAGTIHNSWTENTNDSIKYYVGNTTYKAYFEGTRRMLAHSPELLFDEIHDIVTVKINGITIGTLWYKPYILDLKNIIKSGTNTIEIEVANTWHNALIGNELHKDLKQKTYTNSPYRLKNKPLLPAGIIGSVKIVY